ncbi:hypothetical protein SAMN05216267_10985 [Actinacidiphila rubida]|uniref:Uncharacterized protein n=1 Tax=Actinacidiphila rubida TaxID=310780 RepID=A0A1H8V361_9ACTN|nr:hypothetical protein [Actinacidiphila rubida]SEP09218.1 hypothetical protein SAMN05216267_10985 [Actinacidiphila rubida]
MPRRDKGAGRGSGQEPDIEALLDDLYTTRPPDFVARRAELAAAAKDAGDADGARRLTAARRPTLSAWAANLLALSRPDECRQFLDLGQALREAHQRLDRAQLKELSGQQWGVIAAMSVQARSLAGEAGHQLSDAAQREVEATLRAVLADPDAADRWAAGRLQSPLTPPSSLPASSLPPPAVPAAAAAGEGTTTPGASADRATRRPGTKAPAVTTHRDDLAERRRAKEERLARARAKADTADQRLRSQVKELATAETALDRARTRRDRGRERAEAAEQRLRKAHEDLDRADRALEEAEERHRAAADEHSRAERAARDAAREVQHLDGRRGR